MRILISFALFFCLLGAAYSKDVSAPPEQTVATSAPSTATTASKDHGASTNWAEWVIASATVILVIVTGYLAAYTRKLWASTSDLVSDSKVMTKLQSRAYVNPEGAGIFEGGMIKPPRTDKLLAPGIFVSLKNTGETPAFDVVSWMDIAVIEPINEHTLKFPTLEKKNTSTFGKGIPFPKSLWYERSLSQHEVEDIQKGARRVYVYGRIEYLDVFKEEHFTKFRLHYSGPFPPPEGATLSHSDAGNRAT